MIVLSSGAGYGQISKEFQGRWKFGDEGYNNREKFSKRKSIHFCGDSTVHFKSLSAMGTQEILKVGVVKWAEPDKIAVEYQEMYSGPDEEGKYTFQTYYSEPEFLWLSDRRGNRVRVTFSRVPDHGSDIWYQMRRVASDATCPEIPLAPLRTSDLRER